MKYSLASAALMASAVTAFPFVANQPGVHSTFLLSRQQPAGLPCPNKGFKDQPHTPAVGISAQYPYNGAKNGKPGKGKGGYLVPAIGDKDHEFRAPTQFDIRGPCPGLNVAANHGFLARDGIVTFNELVDAQQNLYNVGYDLAVVLALLGLTTTDGDLITMKLSIGCDATERTANPLFLGGSQPGLNGHNKFEADSSLTRNDYFPNQDNFRYNNTLFEMMVASTGANFNRDGMAKFRYERYQQSRNDNPNFYFGPFSLLLYGASSFLYELMPSGTRNYAADLATISSFFGAKDNGDGTFSQTFEKIPDNWTNRVSPYTTTDVGGEIFAQYLEYPVLFGGATGNGGFDLLNFGSFVKGGSLIAVPDLNVLSCFLYMLLTERVPSSLNTVITPTVGVLGTVLNLLGVDGPNLGCPAPLT